MRRAVQRSDTRQRTWLARTAVNGVCRDDLEVKLLKRGSVRIRVSFQVMGMVVSRHGLQVRAGEGVDRVCIVSAD